MNIARIAAALTFLLIAPTAYAAYNDVTLTTDAVVSVGGYTLNVSGSSAVIQSIVVNSGSFSVTLGSGSSFKVSSPTLNQLSSDITTDVTSNTCTGSESSIALAYSGGGTVTNVITPSATICTTSSGGGGVGGRSSDGSGGGAVALGYSNTNPLPGGIVTQFIAPGKVSTSSPGMPPSSSISGATRMPFLGNLKYGDEGADVLALQQYLNSQLFMVAHSGPGSPGNETSYFGKAAQLAVMTFQKHNHITPISGFFGPLTRALINSSP